MKNSLKEKLSLFWPAIVVLILISINMVLFYLSQGENLSSTIAFLNEFTPENIHNYVAGYGIWAPIILILMLILESVIAPIPGHLLAIAAGMMYGPILGTIIMFIGNMIGSVLCYKLAEYYGRPLVEKFVSKEDLDAIENFIHGKKGILLFFLIRFNPITAFDAISYGAGIIKMNFRVYIIISAVSLLFAGFLYTNIGYGILNGSVFPLMVLSVIFVVLIIALPIIHHRLEKD